MSSENNQQVTKDPSVKRIVISKSKKKRHGIFTEEVVYHKRTKHGIVSTTAHEPQTKK